MEKFTPGKYVNAKFTKEQKEARKLWQRAQKYQLEICETLHVPLIYNREALHNRLDVRINNIERIRAKAKELFDEVDESFTVASMEIQL